MSELYLWCNSNPGDKAVFEKSKDGSFSLTVSEGKDAVQVILSRDDMNSLVNFYLEQLTLDLDFEED